MCGEVLMGEILALRTRIVLICFMSCGVIFGTVGLTGCAAPARPSATTLPAPPIPADVVTKKPLKIGLALGGGAARGFAHVGVIAVLEEAGLKPQLVVGTSAGSLVAALYASGKTSAQLQQTALKDRKSTRLNSSHVSQSRMPSSA